jgi:hypothetical protein
MGSDTTKTEMPDASARNSTAAGKNVVPIVAKIEKKPVSVLVEKASGISGARASRARRGKEIRGAR